MTVIARATTRTLPAVATLAARTAFVRAIPRALGSLRLIEAIKRNLAFVIDLNDLDLHFVADVQHILDALHAALRNAGDVQQAVFRAKQVHEGAERLNGDDATVVHFAHLRLADDELKRVKDRLENECAEVDRLSEVVQSLREEVRRKPEKAEPERVERVEVPAPDARVIRSRVEKARVDGYEEGFAQGFREGAAYGKGHDAR